MNAGPISILIALREQLSRSAAAGAVLALLAGMPPGIAAQGDPAAERVEVPLIDLHREELGTFSWPISTRVPRAQVYFDQGVRLMFAYAGSDSRRSFEQATRLDPACAMCWWGIAWSLGPTFNSGGSLSGEPGRARELVRRASEVAANATPVERALIEAMGVRHGEDGQSPGPGRAPLDSAYAAAMARVYQQFPGNAEVATLYADALMLLEPRRGAWPVEKPAVRRIHTVLEGVLDDDPGHPGACHAYVHATETTPKVFEAQRCADRLGGSIPRASHINHMPSHTYNRVGRWGDATIANLEAWETDRRAQQEEGFATYPSHNLHMLLFSASVDGQGELALRAAEAYGKYDGAGSIGFQALILTRFGHFGRLPTLPLPVSGRLDQGYWHFGQGMAHLRAGAADRARHHLAQIDSLAGTATPRDRFRVHPAVDLLGIVAGVLRAEMLAAEGRMEEAIKAAEGAVQLEEGLMYDEPEPLPFLARDYLGALLLQAGRPDDAERVYREALVARPNNGWSLFGLNQALRAQGRDPEAEEVARHFERAWARADVTLTGSRLGGGDRGNP